MTRSFLTLTAMSLSLALAGTALAQPVADPEPAPPLAPAPAAPGARPVVIPVLVPCDEPGAATCPGPAPVVLPYRGRLPAGPRTFDVSLGITSGVTAGGIFFGSSIDAAPYLGGDLRLRWSRLGRAWGIGLRISGLATINGKGHSNVMYDAEPSYGYESTWSPRMQLWGVEAGFLFDVHGFWLSSGIGVTQYRQNSNQDTIPELSLAVGYDISLGRYVALRLHTAVHSMVLSLRAEAGGGLVFKF